MSKGARIVVVLAVAAAVVAYGVSVRWMPVYEAHATVITSTQDPSQRGFGMTLVAAPELAITTYRSVVLSRPVAFAALLAVYGAPPTAAEVRELQGAMSVRIEDGFVSAVLRISVRDTLPGRGRDLANAVAEAVVRWDVERAADYLELSISGIEAQIASIDSEIGGANPNGVGDLQNARAELSVNLASARALRSATVGRLVVLEDAETPRESVSPRPLRNAVLAALVVAFALIGVLLIREATSTRFRTIEDVMNYTGLHVLATFPRKRGSHRPYEPAAYLRAAITSAALDLRRVVMVTSAHSGQGKTDVSIALAASFARYGVRTLLLEGDVRNPAIAASLGSHSAGATSADRGYSERGRSSVTTITTAGAHLDVLWSTDWVTVTGEPAGADVHRVLASLSEEYEAIVIDGAPVLPVADALAIAPYCTDVVMVASLAERDQRGLKRAISMLRRLGMSALGIVVTDVSDVRSRDGGFGYGDQTYADASRGRRGGARRRLGALVQPNTQRGRRGP